MVLDACNNKNPTSKTFDLAFIGDSFTEGLGMIMKKHSSELLKKN